MPAVNADVENFALILYIGEMDEMELKSENRDIDDDDTTKGSCSS